MKKMKNVLHFRSLKLDYTGLVSGRNQLTRLTWPLNKTLLSPPLLIRLSFRVAVFSWNHFFWDKIKKMRQSIQPNWQKALKKDDFFEVFLTTMNANSTKKMEKCGLLKNCLKLWVTIRKKHRSILDKNVDLFKRSLWVGAMEARWSWAKFAQLVWVQWGILDKNVDLFKCS